MNTSEQNYKLIRKTAMELFQEKGFDQVTVKDICDASGVPRRSFYSLFSNKDELILSYFKLDQKLLADVDSFRDLLMKTDSYDKLIGIIQIYLQLLEKNGPVFLSQIFRISIQNEKSPLFDMASGVKELSCQLIEQCQKEGSILNQAAPEFLWESVVTHFVGICYIWCSGVTFPLTETAISRFEDLVNTDKVRRQEYIDSLIL